MEKLKLIKRENEISKLLLEINKSNNLKDITIQYIRELNQELKEINMKLLEVC